MVLTEPDCFPGLNTITNDDDRLRIAANWRDGKFRHDLLSIEIGDYPVDILRIDTDYFYVAMGPKLEIFRRLDSGLLDKDNPSTECDHELPIYAMDLKGQHLFTSTLNNRLSYYFDRGQKVEQFELQYLLDPVTDLDFNLNTNILAASDRKNISIVELRNNKLQQKQTSVTQNKCIKFNTVGNHLYFGQVSDTYEDIPSAISVYDMGQLTVTPLDYTSKGVMTIELYSPHELLIADLSGELRFFDLRVQRSMLVARNQSKGMNVGVKHDGQYGVLCGFKGSGEITLNDMRMIQNPLQTYELRNGRDALLGFEAEPRHLFCYIGDHVSVLDFDHADGAPGAEPPADEERGHDYFS